MQSTVAHVPQVARLRTRNSVGDIVAIAKLNWPTGQTYFQKLAPEKRTSTARK